MAAFSGLDAHKAASGYTLQVSSSGLSGATTSAITVTPAAASQLVITQQPPSSVAVNGGFGLQATIEDAYGNVVTTASSTVKVALDNNPTGAKLGGTLSVKSSQGVAIFSGLTLNKVGLRLHAPGLQQWTHWGDHGGHRGDARPAEYAFHGGASRRHPTRLLAPLVLDSPDFLDTWASRSDASSL